MISTNTEVAMQPELRTILSSYTRRDYTADSLLVDLFDDELDVIELFFTVEEEFQITIPNEVAAQLHTVGALAEYIGGVLRPPEELSAREKIAWKVRAHLAQAANTTVDDIDPRDDLTDDLGVPELVLPMVVAGFTTKHFGVSLEFDVASGVRRVEDLTALVVADYETAGLDCLCATTFMHDSNDVAIVACNKACPRKNALASMGDAS